VARRAERDLFHLMHNEAIPQEGLQYLNRLSDFLFVISRTLNKSADQSELFWKPS
jgi:cob(I)alamin adenosyltransferase